MMLAKPSHVERLCIVIVMTNGVRVVTKQTRFLGQGSAAHRTHNPQVLARMFTLSAAGMAGAILALIPSLFGSHSNRCPSK